MAPPALPEEEPPEEDPDPAQRYGQQLEGERAGGSWLSPSQGWQSQGQSTGPCPPAPSQCPLSPAQPDPGVSGFAWALFRVSKEKVIPKSNGKK